MINSRQLRIITLIGIFQSIAHCKMQTVENVAQIFPISTVHHSLPTTGGRTIPVKIIHFRKEKDELEGSASQNTPQEVIFPDSLKVPRGFRDDFDNQSKVNTRRAQLENRFEIQVPIISPNATMTKWVPGELIVSEITRRQMKMIDQSRFGPLRSITFVPSVRSAIIVFEKRYNPEKLAIALKYLYGVDSEPNGMIASAN